MVTATPLVAITHIVVALHFDRLDEGRVRGAIVFNQHTVLSLRRTYT